MSIDSIRWIVVVILSTLLLWFIYQLMKGKSPYDAVLRNNDSNSSYSLAKTQLLWWTIIVCMCFAISYAHTGTAQDIINSSCLILLGISLGTTVAGKVIDNGEESNPAIVRHQNVRPARYFWIDLLSDHYGINLHRFQALIFNILYGVIFVIQFFDDGMDQLPVFDSVTLGLLGISSGGYLALKANENNPSQHQAARATAPVATSTPQAPQATDATSVTSATATAPPPSPKTTGKK